MSPERNVISRAVLLAGVLSSALASSAATAAPPDLSGWHADGQTWLQWDDDPTFGPLDTWEIYRAPFPISDVLAPGVERIARMYPVDLRAERLQIASAGARFSIPTPAGGSVTVPAGRSLFVYTPRAAIAEHFAVVRFGGSSVPAASGTVGPIQGSLAPVTCHRQLQGVSSGSPFTIYSLWIDGDDDEGEAGRPDLPIMGNASFRGTAHLMAVFDPQPGVDLPVPSPTPAVISLHGGGGNYWKMQPSFSAQAKIGLHVSGGLYVTFDDNVYLLTDLLSPGTPTVVDSRTRWLGYYEGFDRFKVASDIPAEGKVRNYTQVRMAWQIEWLIANRDVDANRVSMMGVSMGGRGTSMFARYRPDMIAAAHDFVGNFELKTSGLQPLMQGNPTQDLETNLGVNMINLYRPSVPIPASASSSASGSDVPFVRYIFGTEDANGFDTKPPELEALDDTRFGGHFYWDARAHSSQSSYPPMGTGPGTGWDYAYFVGSPKLDAQALLEHRADRAFPAFSRVDHLPGTASIDPDPAVQPSGTRGGWLTWDPTSIQDQAGTFGCDLRVEGAATFGPDNAPTNAARTDITIRRAQAFLPIPHEPVAWRLEDPVTQQEHASGVVQADANGTVTIEGVVLTKALARLVVDRVQSGTLQFGESFPGCGGSPTIQASGDPMLGNASFAISGSGGPPSAPGYLALHGLPDALPVLGVVAYVDLIGPPPPLLLAVATGSAGSLSVSLPVPLDPVLLGLRFYSQFLWVDGCAPLGVSASPGLAGRVTP